MFHRAFHPANVCEDQTGPLHGIQKSLTFLGHFCVVTFSGPVAGSADDLIYRVVVMLCNTAHRWTISARFLRNFTVYFQCVTLPFLQLQFHW